MSEEKTLSSKQAIKVKEIKDLLDFITKSGLEEVNIETEEFSLNVKRSPKFEGVLQAAPAIAYPSLPSMPTSVSQPAAPKSIEEASSATTSPKESKVDSNYIAIKSPMIGTFYRASGPDQPSFVNVGDKVEVGKTVCIIEAMKLFNEIESDIKGTIVKILVENAQPVEYDQPLFLVDPS